MSVDQDQHRLERDKALSQWRAGLRDHVLDALPGGNAARLLGRE